MEVLNIERAKGINERPRYKESLASTQEQLAISEEWIRAIL